MKAHTNAIGGKWAAFVKDIFEEAFDSTVEAADALEDKSTSDPFECISKQPDYCKYAWPKFDVDEETPSGVEDIRNSTQRTQSLNLMLSVSRIMAPTQGEEEEDNKELQRPSEEDFLVNDEESNAERETIGDNDEEETDDDEDETVVSCDGETNDDDMLFTYMEENATV